MLFLGQALKTPRNFMSLVCTHSPVFFSVIVNWCVLFCLHSISSGGLILTFVLITSDQLVLQTIAPDSTNDLFMACFSSSEPCQQISWNTWFKAAPHSSHLRHHQPVYPSSWNNEMMMGNFLSIHCDFVWVWAHLLAHLAFPISQPLTFSF